MHVRENTLDDLLQQVFSRLLRSKNRTHSTRGPAREIVAALLTLNDPRARFSRTEQKATLFSCLGETLWYLSGSADFDTIEYYIPNYRRFAGFPLDARADDGAYGPRIFGQGKDSQIQSVIGMLKRKTDTRQAVVQLFDVNDLVQPSTNVPCTCTLQFLARGRKLHMFVNMRSNDAYRGLPHDIFAFTVIQELIARSVDHEVGAYHHAVGSLHLYDDTEGDARRFLSEGWQEELAMPPMPRGDPWASVKWLLSTEESIRLNHPNPHVSTDIDPYWRDLARLLKIKLLLSRGDMRGVVQQKNAMSSSVYDSYIRGKERRLPTAVSDQLSFLEEHDSGDEGSKS